MNNTVACPVDFKSINENKVRLIALFIFILSLTFIFTAFWPIALFLAIDFFLRSFGLGKYSFLALLSGQVLKLLRVGEKPIDQAPKRFAARIGLLFSIAMLTLSLIALPHIAIWVAVVLSCFSFLESFVGFCAGCHVYTLLRKITDKYTKFKLT